MHLGISVDKDFDETFANLKHNRHDFIEIEGLANKTLDPMRFFKSFLKSNNVANVSIDDNSNVNSQAITTLISESQKPLTKLLSYNKIYIEMKEAFGKETADKYLNSKVLGDIYEHDNFSTSFIPYCFSYSIQSIAERGLYFINEMKADKPKHLDTYHQQCLEATSFFTNLQAGAVGLVDFLLFSFHFWDKDVKSNHIRHEDRFAVRDQEFQKIIFSLNQPYLKGQTQSCYSNFSIMDRDYFIGLFGGLEFDNGTLAIDIVDEFMEYQKAFLNFVRVERAKKSFTFPVLTASLIFKDGEYQDQDMAKFCIKHNLKWGDMNIYVSDSPDKLSSCCRAQFDTKEILKGKKLEGNFNSIGGTDLNIGSTKVVTINLPRLGYKHRGDFDGFKKELKEYVDLIQKFHSVHRTILKKNIERGLLPTYEHGLMDMNKQFATIGVTGMEEFVELMGGVVINSINEKFYSENGINIAKDTLDYINKLGEDTVERYDFTQNVEQIPGESANVKLLKKDRIYFDNPDLFSNKTTYSNQWCGLDSNFPLDERIRVSGILDNCTGGGQILHLNLGEQWSSFEEAWKFNNSVAKAGVKYWSEIRKYQYCANDHNFFGDTCPFCQEPSKGNIIKIVGYLTKDEFYKKERKEELDKRVFYDANTK